MDILVNNAGIVSGILLSTLKGKVSRDFLGLQRILMDSVYSRSLLKLVSVFFFLIDIFVRNFSEDCLERHRYKNSLYCYGKHKMSYEYTIGKMTGR